MTRAQLLRELRRLAKAQGMQLSIVTNRGKGSHIRVTLGGRTTTIKDGELTPGYVRLIKRQLEIKG